MPDAEAHTLLSQRSHSGLAGLPAADYSNGPPLQRISLMLDNSNLSSASNPPTTGDRAGEVLGVMQDDKRRILEARMTNAASASIIESVVGFSNDSRGESSGQGHASYVPGAPSSPTARSATTVFVHGVIPSAGAHTASQDRGQVSILARGASCESRNLEGRKNEGGGRKESVDVPMTEVREDTARAQDNFSAEELASSEDEGSSSAASNGDSRMSNASQGDSRGPLFGAYVHSGATGPDREGRGAESGSGAQRERERGRKKRKHGGEDVGSGKKTGQGKRGRAIDAPSPDGKSGQAPDRPRPITQFFQPRPSAAAPATPHAAHRSTVDGQDEIDSGGKLAEAEQALKRREAALEARAAALRDQEAAVLRREENIAELEEDARERAREAARQDVQDAAALRRQHDQHVRTVVRRLLVKAAQDQRAAEAAKLAGDTARVGRVSYMRRGMLVQEVWEKGSAWGELERLQDELAQDRERLDRDRKAFQKRCRAALAPASGQMAPPPVPTDEQAEQEEIYRLRAQKLKDRDKELAEKRERLEREKHTLIREIKRVQDQSTSKYSNFPLLNNRYLLLHLLGKGGFSEVYHSFDLQNLEQVACKIHELNPQWSEEKRTNYMKHATREYEIQKKLSHTRIVRLVDVFEVSTDGFCTVLEHCDSGDLEHLLKEKRTLPEREARSIIMQVFAGLKYLNEQKQKIIHYDLKPGNILFHNGEVKISDFGLSKVMEEQEITGAAGAAGEIELTSQGAGTYWYLPPECFEVGTSPPKISSKVDVWSAGVIFYQMLFGCKPFGHGMSQDHMLRDQVITKSTSVKFPEGKDVPKVSERAKEFVRRCLAYRASERPSVMGIFQDPYLRHTGRQASTAGGPASANP